MVAAGSSWAGSPSFDEVKGFLVANKPEAESGSGTSNPHVGPAAQAEHNGEVSQSLAHVASIAYSREELRLVGSGREYSLGSRECPGSGSLPQARWAGLLSRFEALSFYGLTWCTFS